MTSGSDYLYIELAEGTANIQMIRCRIYAWAGTAGVAAADCDIDIDLYYAAAWVNIWSGDINMLEWVEIVNAAGEQTVSRARIRYNGAETLEAYEFDFCEI